MAKPEQERETLIRHPGSFVFPLPLCPLFSKRQPLEIELGSGNGSFLVAYAREHPERNLIGVERLLGRVRKSDRRARRQGVRENLRLFCLDGLYFLNYLIPCHSLATLHIYFPDPWPKARHKQRRMIGPAFVGLAFERLRPDGVLYFRTDNRDYFQHIVSVFSRHPGFVPTATPRALAEITTKFESEFQMEGFPTLRVAFQKDGRS